MTDAHIQTSTECVKRLLCPVGYGGILLVASAILECGLEVNVKQTEGLHMDRTEAVKEAVRYCTGKGILSGFLKEHGSEAKEYVTDGMELERCVTGMLKKKHGKTAGRKVGRKAKRKA
jgi:hypothetical protein